MTFAKIKIPSNTNGNSQFARRILGLGGLLLFVLAINLLTFFNKHEDAVNQDASELPVMEKTINELQDHSKSVVNAFHQSRSKAIQFVEN